MITALLPLLQAAYTMFLDSSLIIFLGLTALGCLLPFAVTDVETLHKLHIPSYVTDNYYNTVRNFYFSADPILSYPT